MLRGKAKEILTKFKSVNPQDLKLLQSKHIEGRKSGKENLFQSILRYDSNWYEKRVLFNPEIAEDITDKILKSSQSTDFTPFVDTDGGLCLISRKIREKCPEKPIYLFEKDIFLYEKLPFFKDDPKAKRDSISFTQSAIQNYTGELSECRIASSLLHLKNGWDNDVPALSLFSFCPHGVCKFLADDCLKSWDLQNGTKKATLFTGKRPEFFFLMTDKTFQCLCGIIDKYPFMRRKIWGSVLFQILFESELLGQYHYQDFMPWKLPPASKSYDYTQFFLVKVRPKKDFGLEDKKNFNAELFSSFCKLAFLGDAKNDFIAKIETFMPGIGFDFIKDGGASMADKRMDIPIKDYVKFYNIAARKPNFYVSTFAISAQVNSNATKTSD